MFSPYTPENNELFKMFAKLEYRQLPMFYAVYLGIKPLMDTFIRYEHYLELKDEAAKHGVLVGHNGMMIASPDEEFLKRKERFRNPGTTKMIAVPFDENRRDALVHAFISKYEDKIEEARSLTWYNLFVGEHQLAQPAIDNYRYGATLGFPECCVKFYAAHNGRFCEDNYCWEWNTPFEVCKNTHGDFSYLCNHIPMDFVYFLIHHYPCSYNCKITMELAQRVLEGIRELDRGFADKIEWHLKLPYLMFNEKKAFALNGEIRGNRIRYDESYFLGDFRDLETYDLVRSGNMVEVNNENIIVFRDNTEIGRYPAVGNYRGKIYQFH
ncbi:MAG: hypothetical protein LWY06_19580 [Firmicutes bacterium]|nr:hypothetical protein [Bacillota bacterium]